jgi:hypothetical protein
MLGARHADRDRKTKLRPHAAPDCPGNFGRRTEEMGAARDVGKGLVDGYPLDGWSDMSPPRSAMPHARC